MCSKLKKYFENLVQQQKKYKKELKAQRQQNQTFIQDIKGNMISSLGLVNSLPNGKIQTVNSMKYHSRTLQGEYNINFKYHYLRHTYGTTLATLNTPEHLLCNQMGHSSSAVTHKYYGIYKRKLGKLQRFYSYTTFLVFILNIYTISKFFKSSSIPCSEMAI